MSRLLQLMVYQIGPMLYYCAADATLCATITPRNVSEAVRTLNAGLSVAVSEKSDLLEFAFYIII